MSQRTLIFSFLQEETELSFTYREIADILDIPKQSVSRELSNLNNEGLIGFEIVDGKTAYFATEDASLWKKYTYNSVLYCSSKPFTVKAVTYSNEDLDVNKLLNEMSVDVSTTYGAECSPVAYESEGLDIREVIKPDENAIYPDIEVSSQQKYSQIKLKQLQKGQLTL